MRKLLLILLPALFIFSGCKKEHGFMTVDIIAFEAQDFSADFKSKDEEVVSIEKVNPDTTVVFYVDVDSKKDVEGTFNIKNEFGHQILNGIIVENTFEYKFEKSGEYSIEVLAMTSKDYGRGFSSLKVDSSMKVPEWKLKNNTFTAGEVALFDLSELKNLANIVSLDVRIISFADGKSILFEKDVDAEFSYYLEEYNYGNFKMHITLHDANGNKASVEDQLVIMNPANPISIIFNASRNDEEYPDQIMVKGEINSPNELVEIKLIRTAYYGKEHGIEPLSEPQKTGGVEYSKVGKALVAKEEVYIANAIDSPFVYDEAMGLFEFLDPMPYTNEDGAEVETGFKWTYAKFDREAWKYIKRKKNFDMTRALSVDYRIEAVSVVDPMAVPSATQTGYPYLSTEPMAMMCMWLKEVAFNRLWHFQVPKYCWDNTVAWLLKAQSYKSADGRGDIRYAAKGLSGEGTIRNYSDWPGITLHSDNGLSIAVKTESKQKREHGLDLNIKTPLYPEIYFNINNISVRDFILQWGIWNINDDASGYIEIRRGGKDGVPERVDAKRLVELMPVYQKHDETVPGYGYDESDYIKYSEANDGAAPTTWTTINFKFPPNPSRGGWRYNVWSDVNDPDWSMYYEVE